MGRCRHWAGAGASPASPSYEVVDRPEEGIGRPIDWSLTHGDGWTTVNFGLRDWREPVLFMHECNTQVCDLPQQPQAARRGRRRAPARDLKIVTWEENDPENPR